MPPLGMHAYRLFSSENRHEVQTALKFEGKPAGMSDVAKVLGQKWRELSEESKKARGRVCWAAPCPSPHNSTPLLTPRAPPRRRCTWTKPAQRCVHAVLVSTHTPLTRVSLGPLPPRSLGCGGCSSRAPCRGRGRHRRGSS